MIQGDLAKETLGVNGKDFSILTRVVLEGIHLVCELELEDRIKVGESIPRAGYFAHQETRELLVARDIGETTTNDTAEIFQRNLEDNTTITEERKDTASAFYGNDTTLNCQKFDLSKTSYMYNC